MKKFAIYAMLVGLSMFTVGCNSPEQKKADAEKKMIDAEADQSKTAADAQAKEDKTAEQAQESIDKEQVKKEDAAKDAAHADQESAEKMPK